MTNSIIPPGPLDSQIKFMSVIAKIFINFTNKKIEEIKGVLLMTNQNYQTIQIGKLCKEIPQTHKTTFVHLFKLDVHELIVLKDWLELYFLDEFKFKQIVQLLNFDSEALIKIKQHLIGDSLDKSHQVPPSHLPANTISNPILLDSNPLVDNSFPNITSSSSAIPLSASLNSILSCDFSSLLPESFDPISSTDNIWDILEIPDFSPNIDGFDMPDAVPKVKLEIPEEESNPLPKDVKDSKDSIVPVNSPFQPLPKSLLHASAKSPLTNSPSFLNPHSLLSNNNFINSPLATPTNVPLRSPLMNHYLPPNRTPTPIPQSPSPFKPPQAGQGAASANAPVPSSSRFPSFSIFLQTLTHSIYIDFR